MNNFTIYRNYGVLRAEKRNVYTYGAPHINGVCSDELKVKLLDDCDWKLFENNFGQTMIETLGVGHIISTKYYREMKVHVCMLWIKIRRHIELN